MVRVDERFWVRVNKGDEVPTKNGKGDPVKPVEAGITSTDGALAVYVAMSMDGEVGKYNRTAENGRLCNLWTHNGGKHHSGYLMVCPDDKKAFWKTFQKGEDAPGWAFQSSIEYDANTSDKGVLYIGAYKGEPGKINTLGGYPGGKLHNLWCHNSGKHDDGKGSILCVKAKHAGDEPDDNLLPTPGSLCYEPGPCIVSFPAKYGGKIWIDLLSGKVDVSALGFTSSDRLNWACVWTGYSSAPKEEWYDPWEANCKRAKEMGKTLLVVYDEEGQLGVGQTAEVKFMRGQKPPISYTSCRLVVAEKKIVAFDDSNKWQ